MGTVLVAEGDKVLVNKGYGRAVVEWNIPNTPDVKFRLGSMTKQFTAALILLLQQDGKPTSLTRSANICPTRRKRGRRSRSEIC